MSWFAWLFRAAERDRAYTRLKAARQSYGAHGDRIIRLSARTDLLRKSVGATARAFEFVEKSFVTATMEYARVGHLIDNLEQGLRRGQIGNFDGIDQAIRGVGPLLDELDRHLTKWETRWHEVPRELTEAEAALAALRSQAENAGAALGTPLPVQRNLESLNSYLHKAKEALAAGNPLEAGQLLDDLELAQKKVATEVGLYASGLGAVEQVEQSLARLKAMLGNAEAGQSDAITTLTAVEALLSRLRPALAAGNFERFQHDLLDINRQIGRLGNGRHDYKPDRSGADAR